MTNQKFIAEVSTMLPFPSNAVDIFSSSANKKSFGLHKTWEKCFSLKMPARPSASLMLIFDIFIGFSNWIFRGRLLIKIAISRDVGKRLILMAAARENEN